MFEVIGNISNLPTVKDLASLDLGATDKHELATKTDFVALRYSTQNKAIDVIAQHTGLDKSKTKNVNSPGFQRIEIPDTATNRLAEILHIRKPMARVQVLEPGNMC